MSLHIAYSHNELLFRLSHGVFCFSFWFKSYDSLFAIIVHVLTIVTVLVHSTKRNNLVYNFIITETQQHNKHNFKHISKTPSNISICNDSCLTLLLLNYRPCPWYFYPLVFWTLPQRHSPAPLRVASSPCSLSANQCAPIQSNDMIWDPTIDYTLMFNAQFLRVSQFVYWQATKWMCSFYHTHHETPIIQPQRPNDSRMRGAPIEPFASDESSLQYNTGASLS